MSRDVMLEMTGLLKSARMDSGYTQSQIAKKIGISRETVIAIEKSDKATVGSLKVEIVARWWVACKLNTTLEKQTKFAEIIKKVFKIN